MADRSNYRRLLEDVNRHFSNGEPTWVEIRAWIEEEARKERVREDVSVPATVQALNQADDPSLHPGDVVLTPLLVRGDSYKVPPQCRLGASLHALGSVEIGEGVQIAEDLIAGQEIYWRGGPQSSVRNLVGQQVQLASAPGIIYGSVWANRIRSEREDVHLAPGTFVQGAVIVQEAPKGHFVVGAGTQLGGLFVPGAVETRSNVTISHLRANGRVILGRNSRVGYLQGAQVLLEPGCCASVIVSSGSVEIRENAIADTIRAREDITLASGVTITGSMLRSEQGQFHIPAGDGWHTRSTHWFYQLPDGTLHPYEAESTRPDESALLALQILTHELWERAEKVAGGVG